MFNQGVMMQLWGAVMTKWIAAIAACVICALGAAGPAAAAIYTPTGPDHVIDAPLDGPGGGYGDDAAFKVTFDPALFSEVSVNVYMKYINFYEIYPDCSPRWIAPCGDTEGGLDAYLTLDPSQSQDWAPWSGVGPTQIYIRPQSDGFTFTMFADNGCSSTLKPGHCHEYQRVVQFFVYGKTLSGDPISISMEKLATPSRSAVPEPATWAMMIAGFGLVGSTLRRRRALA
jgi:hypothetical protein